MAMMAYSVQEQRAGWLSTFARYVRLYGAGLSTILTEAHSGTVFAPSNEAFKALATKIGQKKLDDLLASPGEGARILGLHFVDQRVPSDDIRITQPQNDIKVGL